MQDCSGRVVGGTQEDKSGAVGDRGGHRVEVVTQILRQRHRDRGGPGDLGQDWVGLEGPPRKDNLVTSAGEGMHELAGYLRRSSPHRHLAHVDAEVTGDTGAYFLGTHRRVTVEPRQGARDGFNHTRQWFERVLVG